MKLFPYRQKKKKEKSNAFKRVQKAHTLTKDNYCRA